MKRIVNGVTYNTETSTALGRLEYESDDGPVEETLYQTRGGAFFVDEKATREVWNERDRVNETKVANTFVPKSRDQAHEWIMTDNAEILSNPFDDPPEAAAENDPGATIYIRVPASLKKRVDDAAREGKLSGNVWAMRCVEMCLSGLPDELNIVWHIATSGCQDNDWDSLKYVRAMSQIATLLEHHAQPRFGRDAFANASHGYDSTGLINEYRMFSGNP